MELEKTVQQFSTGFTQSASVAKVFGEPINAGEKVIIPVAGIAYGFGTGQGKGGGKKYRADEAANGEGGGAGGGMYAQPKGVFEVTGANTRYIPANSAKQILIGVAIGFVLKMFFFKRKRRKALAK